MPLASEKRKSGYSNKAEPLLYECFSTKQKALNRGCIRQMQDELNFTTDFSLHE